MPDFELEPFLPTANAIGWMVLDGFLMLAAVIALVRMAGLRSFAKMSSFDFAVTVASGSILGSIVLNADQSFTHGAIAIGALLCAQVLVARGRLSAPWFRNLVDNEPLLLMDGPEILEANLKAGRVTRQDVIAKLREANVLSFSQVRAVVLETTGDISVLHGDTGGADLEPRLLQDVRR
ncbi:DUF421 domain-containing protein [Rhizobiaceae bacterium]|nr:DUF421 domain-containing protein [Rhizobiaceae bacterium]